MKNPHLLKTRIENKKNQVRKLEIEIKSLQEEMDVILQTHVLCQSCDIYHEKKSLPIETYDETKTECIQHDSGYGDDDVLADVTRHYCVQRCPVCYRKIGETSVVKSITNKRTRR